ncbi:MAG TPA: methylated-DNA--[protein]-cysteine S-methyltransferase [Sandaracinaceae bacterium LLY-WYZ-13_1]|nr:methylated-DNA--[protein]-cysteine S-methyltransferase [Sandaracinaceae bacterium LLY-WYZ-13_1]
MLDAPVVGPLWLAWVPEGLTMLRFGADPPAERARARFWPEADGSLPEGDIPDPVYDTLRRYFGGDAVDPATLPVRLGGTRFQRRTWAALRRVPRGRVRTYAGLAKDVGSPRAMRAIGVAMGANPIAVVVPCHRVVGTRHTLGGYSGGLERKRALLELEGVVVDGDQVLPGQLELL